MPLGDSTRRPAVPARPRIVTRARRAAFALTRHGLAAVVKRAAFLLTRRALAAVAARYAHGSAHPAPRQAGGRERVTIVLAGVYSTGGITRTAMNLAASLSDCYDVDLVSVIRRRQHPQIPFPTGVRVVPLDDVFAPHGRLWWAVRTRLVRFRSVLVHPQDSRYHLFSLWTDWLLVRHLRGLDGTLITTRPGLNVAAARLAPRHVSTIGQEHMHLASHRVGLRAAIARHYPDLGALAVLTESDRKDYARLFSSGRPPVLHLPNAVPDVGGGQADPSSKVVIAVGRLTRQKGFDLLIRAWADVARKHPDWTLRIYGTGVERPALKRLIADHRLAGRVRLMGRTDRIGDAYAQASVFVLSSRHEGLPMVILEAMSKGLPVVSFDCPTGPAEVVTDDNGILVPNGDVPGLAQALSEVMADDERRVRLGKGAQETAAKYEAATIARRWVELVEDLRRRSDGAQPRSAGR